MLRVVDLRQHVQGPARSPDQTSAHGTSRGVCAVLPLGLETRVSTIRYYRWTIRYVTPLYAVPRLYTAVLLLIDTAPPPHPGPLCAQSAQPFARRSGEGDDAVVVLSCVKP